MPRGQLRLFGAQRPGVGGLARRLGGERGAGGGRHEQPGEQVGLHPV